MVSETGEQKESVPMWSPKTGDGGLGPEKVLPNHHLEVAGVYLELQAKRERDHNMVLEESPAGQLQWSGLRSRRFRERSVH